MDLGRRIRHETLTLSGMDCPDCAMKLEKGVQRVPGVLSAQVNFAAARMWVEYEPDAAALTDVVRQIETLGYGVEDGNVPAGPVPFWVRYRNFLATGSSGLFLLLGFLAAWLGAPEIVPTLLYATAILSGGYPLARTAVGALRTFTFDTDFLMLVAALGAALIGEWIEGAMVIFLFSLGNSLESMTVEKTRASIRGLMEMAPQTATLIKDGGDVEIPVEQIRPGDEVRVKPGGKVPVDGVVLTGTSSVEEAAITGEPLPVEKDEGDSVYAGTLNGDGSLVVRSLRPFEETTLSKIVHLVEEAQAQKAPSQRFTERFGRIYTPSVIAAALVTGIAWPLMFNLPFAEWFHRALTFLVVACPCALVISTPVAVAAAIGRAARQGVLSKGGAAMEALGSVRCIAFDKTGTLTAGKPAITGLMTAAGVTEGELLSAAAAVEVHSQHPIARAVLNAAEQRGIGVKPSESFASIPGRGAEGLVNGRTVFAGNRAYLEGQGIALDSLGPQVAAWLSQGKTPVWVGRDGQLMGALAVEDTIREVSRDALERLRRMGVEQFVMLTGDDERAARAVAKELGITEIRANLLPEEKVEAVRELLKRYGRVAMVGDGVNDAPALALATVGVAMGAAGSDVSLETADVALMGDDLHHLAFAVGLSRKMLAVIRQNLAFSFFVVAVLVGSILFNRIGLAVGVLGHEGSALLVILNGMRLLKEKAAA
ncbi:MAG: cadmium-translocating P-type ATPase [Armatimonadetes bacterium]|nr:cadmium-translocating P-type ATPase [Armatimonadota bacterium]